MVQVFVKYEMQQTTTSREEVAEVRQVHSGALRQILDSGKVWADGNFADARGAFSSWRWTRLRRSLSCLLR